jgi:hypothetical protein
MVCRSACENDGAFGLDGNLRFIFPQVETRNVPSRTALRLSFKPSDTLKKFDQVKATIDQ